MVRIGRALHQKVFEKTSFLDSLLSHLFEFKTKINSTKIMASADPQGSRPSEQTRDETRNSLNWGMFVDSLYCSVSNKIDTYNSILSYINKMYEKFITDFEHRINPLSLVEICLIMVHQYPGIFKTIFKFIR
jgi:hypothetical protein